MDMRVGLCSLDMRDRRVIYRYRRECQFGREGVCGAMMLLLDTI